LTNDEINEHYRASMIEGDDLYHELHERFGDAALVKLINALTMAIFRRARTPEKAARLTIAAFDMVTVAIKEHFIGWKR